MSREEPTVTDHRHGSESPRRRPRAGWRALGLLALGLLALLPLVACTGGSGLKGKTPEEAQETLTAALEADPLGVLEQLGETRRERVRQAARDFYAGREWQAAWTGAKARRAREEVPKLLEEAADHGLQPSDYRLEDLRQRLEEAPQDPATEAAASLSLLVLAEHLSRGRLGPRELEVEWHIELRETDLARALEDLHVGKGLDALAPRSKGYQDLVEVLRRWREERPWETEPAPVAEGKVMKEGGSFEVARMKQLADRLGSFGILSPQEQATLAEELGSQEAGDGTMPFPGLLAQGLERFQEWRGLEVDGKAGPETLAAVNESARERLERVIFNLERWRWMSHPPSGRHLWVNVPELMLKAYQGGESVLEMPVVVGQPSWQTPAFRDVLTDVVVNPDWNVPVEIAVAETIPKLRENPGYLEEENLEIVGPEGEILDPSSIEWEEVRGAGTFDFRFRQRPGPWNALGRIKFLFPNNFDVYFHDTPEQAGFQENQRDLSHGCIRVSRPLDLAGYVLARTPGWTTGRVDQVIRSRERTWIDLKEEIPVHIVYFTAYLGATGELVLREDLYGYDAKMGEALRRRYGERSYLEAFGLGAEEEEPEGHPAG